MAYRQPGFGGVAGPDGSLEQRLDVLDTVLEPVIVWRLGGAIVYWNDEARRLYGYSKDEATGRVIHELLRTEFPDNCSSESVEAALAQDGEWSGDLIHQAKQGSRIVVQARLRAARLFESPRSESVGSEAADPSVLVVEANRDVTESKRVEQDAIAWARRQERVAVLSRASLESTEIERLMAETIRHVTDELQVDHVEICVVAPFGGQLERRAGAGRLRETFDEKEVSELIASQAAFTRAADEPIVVADLVKERRFAVPPGLIACGVASSLSVLIRTRGGGGTDAGTGNGEGDGGRGAGIVIAYARDPREFVQSDVSFMRALADVLGAAWRDEWRRRELQESEARFRGIFEQAAVGIARVDLDGHWLQFNPAMCRITGYSAKELARIQIKDVIHPEDLNVDLAHLADLSFGRADSYTMDKRYVRRDGSVAWVSLSRSIVRDSGGKPLYYVSVVEDVSERRRAEQAARDGEARMRAVVDTAIDAIVTIDERGLIESANPSACALFGYALAELLGRNVRLLMPQPYAGEHDGYMRNYLRTRRAKIIGIGRDVLGRRRDGSVFPLHLGVSAFMVGGRQMFAGVLRDLTDQRRLEREILEIGAAEQRRIGQDLHDGVCQELTGIAFALEVLGQKLANRSAAETSSIRKVAELVDQSIGHARSLAHGLQPVTLDASGLASALRELAAKIEETFRVSCLVVSDSDVLVHDNVVATHVFRIAQEAIGNAVKHGKARTIVLDLSEADGWLRLTVSDDGVGLGAATTSDGKGIGLQTMAYRARVVGGRVDVRVGEHGGTVVSCAVPLRGTAVGGTGADVNAGVNDERYGDDKWDEERPVSDGKRAEAKDSKDDIAGERGGADSCKGEKRAGEEGTAGISGRARRSGKRAAKAKGVPRRRPSNGA